MPALRIVGMRDEPADAGACHPGTSDAGRSQGYTDATEPKRVGVCHTPPRTASVGSPGRAVMEIRSLGCPSVAQGGDRRGCRRVAARPRLPLSEGFWGTNKLTQEAGLAPRAFPVSGVQMAEA